VKTFNQESRPHSTESNWGLRKYEKVPSTAETSDMYALLTYGADVDIIFIQKFLLL